MTASARTAATAPLFHPDLALGRFLRPNWHRFLNSIWLRKETGDDMDPAGGAVAA